MKYNDCISFRCFGADAGGDRSGIFKNLNDLPEPLADVQPLLDAANAILSHDFRLKLRPVREMDN